MEGWVPPPFGPVRSSGKNERDTGIHEGTRKYSRGPLGIEHTLNGSFRLRGVSVCVGDKRYGNLYDISEKGYVQIGRELLTLRR